MNQQKTSDSSTCYNNKISFHSRTIELTTILLLTLIPVAFYPYLVRIFNPPKELIYGLLVLVILSIWVLKALFSKDNLNFKHLPLNIPVAIFIFICIISIIWSDNIHLSLLELPIFIAGPALYFVTINNLENNKQIHNIVTAILIIGSLMGIYGFLQYQGVDFSFWQSNIGRQQVFGLFGNVNYFAEYIIIPLTLAVPLFFAAKYKMVKIFLFAGIYFMGSSLVLTFTRGSYLAFGTALLFMFILFILREGITQTFNNHKKLIILFLLLVLIASAIIFIPNPLNERGTALYRIKSRTSIHQMTHGSSIARRMAIWKFTWMMIEDKPILGSGLGTFQYNSLKYQAEFFDQGNNRSIYPYGIADKAHNEYLQLWAELGIIGFIVFLWIVIQYFVFGIRFLKRRKSNNKMQFALIIGFMGAVFAVLIDALFGFPLHLPASISLFWLILAMTVVLFSKEIHERESTENINKPKPLLVNITNKVKKKYYNWRWLRYIFLILLFGMIIYLGILTTKPFISQIYEYKAMGNIQSGDFDKAIDNLHSTIRYNPYSGMAYLNLGQIVMQRELYTVALDYFLMASRYIDHPDLPETLAYIYIKKDMTDEAIAKLKQAITYQQKEITMEPLYSDLGKLYMNKRRYQEAEDVFKKALAIDDKNLTNNLALAISLFNQNKKEEAKEFLERVIQISPDSRESQQSKDLLQQIARENLKPVN